jgi:hypothetical protein
MLSAYSAKKVLDKEDGPIFPRQYCDDFKPFTYVFSLSNLLNVSVMASIEPLNNFNAQFAVYTKRIEAGEKVGEFDFKGFMDTQRPIFVTAWVKNFCVSVVKKTLESIAYAKLPAKITDRLTKDAYKSLARKALRYPRLEVCTRIIPTRMWATSLSYVSIFSVETLLLIYPAISDVLTAIVKKGFSEGMKVLKKINFTKISKKLLRNIIVNLIAWGSAAVGYSLGAYVYMPNGSTYGELLVGGGGMIVGNLLTARLVE